MVARKPLSPLLAASVLVLFSLAACGGSTSMRATEEYPLVQPSPRQQRSVTTPSGAVSMLPALPTVYVTDPSPTCERAIATFHDGSLPTKRPIVIPPAPGLRAVAVTDRTTRIEWSFRDLPADCRPIEILVSVRAGRHPGGTPLSKQLKVRGVAGSTEITYFDSKRSPDVAMASVYAPRGVRSRVVQVLIERAANVPLN